MSADGQLSYARMHTDEDDACEQARHQVPDELYRLLPGANFWPTRVLEVALIPGQDDHPEVHPYRITVQVTIHVEVTATSHAAAISDAETMVNSRLPDLADADITVTGLTWSVYDGPDDLIAEAPAAAGPVRLPDADDDLIAATAARDAATEALADLRRKIRHRAIRALADDEIGSFEQTAEPVEGFLRSLGLAALPRAHHITVTIDLTLRVHTATGHQAYRQVHDTMQAIRASCDWSPTWTAWGYPTAETAVPDGDRWLVAWQHEYDIWLRGHTDPADATTAAQAFARAAITDALTGIDHDLVAVTGIVEDFGIDPHLDPDTD